jgi:dipeptidyl aminopeptidase/acylaminoacyl peptidase
MSTSSRTTGSDGILSVRFFLRAFLAAALTVFAMPWFINQVFVLAALQPPCLPPAPLSQGFKEVVIPTSDGLRLSGLWRPPQNGAVVLFMGGIGANREALLREAGWLADEGFGTLTVESRSCQGRNLTLGYRESGDFLAMVDFARREAGVEWFGAFGFSSGAAAAIRAAAESEDIRAVVAEGGYADLAAMLLPDENRFFSVEGQLQIMNMAAFWQHLNFWPGLVNPLKDLQNVSPRPVLLIYGENEPNRAQAGEMLAAAGQNAVLWIAPGVGHGQYADAEPDRYRQLLIHFFSSAYLENAD